MCPSAQLIHSQVQPCDKANDNKLQTAAGTCIAIVLSFLVLVQVDGMSEMAVSLICIGALCGVVLLLCVIQIARLFQRRALLRLMAARGLSDEIEDGTTATRTSRSATLCESFDTAALHDMCAGATRDLSRTAH